MKQYRKSLVLSAVAALLLSASLALGGGAVGALITVPVEPVDSCTDADGCDPINGDTGGSNTTWHTDMSLCIPTELSMANSQLAGTEYQFSERKTLRINFLTEFDLESNSSGCVLTADANITLLRRLRRNAHGTAHVTADVIIQRRTQGNTEWRRFCAVPHGNFSPNVTINVSHTTEIGEFFYEHAMQNHLSGNCLEYYRS